MVVLHGLGSNGGEARNGSQLESVADEHRFAVAYPTGGRHPDAGPHWNANLTGSTGRTT